MAQPIDLSAGLVPASPPQGGDIDLSAGLVPAPDPQQPSQMRQGVSSFLSALNPIAAAKSAWQLATSPVQTYKADEAQRVQQIGNYVNQIKGQDWKNHPIASAVNSVDPAVGVAAGMVPFVGTAVNDAADEGAQGNYGKALGKAAGLGVGVAAADAVPKVVSGVRSVAGATRDALSIPDDLKTAAAATPDPSDVALAAKKVPDIHAEPLPDLSSRVGSVIDSKAAEIGADTSSATGLSEKAAIAGQAWKDAGQKLYKQADDLYQRATGKAGQFQDLANAIQKSQEALAQPENLTPADEAVWKERLNIAQKNLEAYEHLAADEGVDVKQITALGNKRYSTGLSIEEFGRGVSRQETAGGDLVPRARPLDAPVRQTNTPIQPRGHVLNQAFGEQGAGQIHQATLDAADQIKQSRAATDAAKVRNATAKDSAAAAQKRIEAIRGNRKAVLNGTAKIAGAGAAVYGLGKALSGVKAARGEE